MIQNLKDEGREDIKQRDWCIAERNLENNKKEDLEYDIAQLEAKIERAETKKAGLEADVEKTEKAKEDHDDEKAIGLLENAIAALAAYGENNALVQVPKKHEKKGKKQPEFEVSPDQAPDATFSEGDKHEGASDGIVALLTQIKENLENEIALATKSEAKATEEYDAMKASADAQIAAYDKQLTELAAAIAATDAEIEADTNTKTDTEGEKTATEEYLASIKEQCDWIEGAFTARAEARTKETEGLEQAKSILAGSVGGDFGFLQRH